MASMHQFNIKIERDIKDQAGSIAEQLGFSLSSLTRAFWLHLIRNKKISFSLENEKTDTPRGLTGTKLEKILLASRQDKKTAGRHHRAYDRMLADERKGRLTKW